MADRKSVKVQRGQDFADNDPFAELTRIMGRDPRPEASGSGEADEFGIDLEKELMGELAGQGAAVMRSAAEAMAVPSNLNEAAELEATFKSQFSALFAGMKLSGGSAPVPAQPAAMLAANVSEPAAQSGDRPGLLEEELRLPQEMPGAEGHVEAARTVDEGDQAGSEALPVEPPHQEFAVPAMESAQAEEVVVEEPVAALAGVAPDVAALDMAEPVLAEHDEELFAVGDSVPADAWAEADDAHLAAAPAPIDDVEPEALAPTVSAMAEEAAADVQPALFEEGAPVAKQATSLEDELTALLAGRLPTVSGKAASRSEDLPVEAAPAAEKTARPAAPYVRSNFGMIQPRVEPALRGDAASRPQAVDEVSFTAENLQRYEQEFVHVPEPVEAVPFAAELQVEADHEPVSAQAVLEDMAAASATAEEAVPAGDSGSATLDDPERSALFDDAEFDSALAAVFSKEYETLAAKVAAPAPVAADDPFAALLALGPKAPEQPAAKEPEPAPAKAEPAPARAAWTRSWRPVVEAEPEPVARVAAPRPAPAEMRPAAQAPRIAEPRIEPVRPVAPAPLRSPVAPRPVASSPFAAAPAVAAPIVAAPQARTAPAAPQHLEAPEIETLDVPEAAFALNDDLDIPDIKVEQAPPPPMFDDIEAEFANVFSDMAPEPQPVAESRWASYQPVARSAPVRAETHADEAFVSDFRRYAASAASAAPRPSAYQPTYQPAYQPAPAAARAPQPAENFDYDPLAYDPELEEAISIPDLDEAFEEAYAAPPPRRRWPLAAALVVGVAVIGGIGAFALSFGGGPSGGPVLVKADDSPLKVKPQNPGGSSAPAADNKVFDRMKEAGGAVAPTQEKLVTTAQEPVDMAARAAPRAVTPAPVPAAAAPATTVPATTAPAMAAPTTTAKGARPAVPSAPVAAQPAAVQPAAVQPAPPAAAEPATPPSAAPAVAAAPVKSEERVAAAPASAAPVAAEEVAVAPRKVRTMIVKPDGSLAPREEPAPQVSAAAPQPAASPATASARAETPAVAPREAAEQPSAASRRDVATPSRVPVAPSRPADQPVTITGATNAAQRNQQVAGVQPRAVQTTTIRPPVETVSAPAAAAAAPVVTGSDGSWSMQIASQPTAEGAQSAYQDLSGRYGSIIGGKGVNIVKASIDGKGTYYRVRIPASNRDEAVQLCTRYKAAGGSCFVSK